jgi:8-oxo-dGTP diphosphatase
MTIAHRIAAGGIIIKNDAILLVRYTDAKGGSYLVGPGGAAKDQENAFQAVVRETLEETGLTVRPRKILFVEDLLCSKFKMCKIWVLCDSSGEATQRTDGARIEGITEAGWFRRGELVDEVVFPSPVMTHGWQEFASDSWQVQCLPSKKAGF